MFRFGLATKITVPFVLLFSLLLTALGVVLTRAIFSELEAQVERQLRLTLSIVEFERLPPQPSFLRQLLKSSSGEDPERSGMELVIKGDSEVVVTTLEKANPAAEILLKDLEQRIQDRDIFPGLAGFGKDVAAGAPVLNGPGAGAEVQSLEGMEAAEEIQVTHCLLDERPYLVLYRSGLYKARWLRYFLIYPRSNIEAAQDRALRNILTLGAFGLTLAALLGRMVAQWITRPVRRLAAAAGRLASGGLNEALEPESSASRDEIGELNRAFRAMVDSLRKSQQEKLQAERFASVGKLAASVAHEIRNPLTSLRMTIQMLSDKHAREDDGAREAYDVVLGAVDRLALSVEELLTLARPRPAKRTPTDLGRLVTETAVFLERQLEHAHVALRIENDPALPRDIPLDGDKIRQLLVNLLLNAMQAIVRDGQIVARTKWNEAQRTAILEVSDNGPGVAAEVRDRIFELFVSTKDGGGGLGLAVAKQIAEEHRGSISFETSAKGATFRVVLPIEGRGEAEGT